MTRIEQLKVLDGEVLAFLERPDELDDIWLSKKLQTRAQLLRGIIEQGGVSQSDSAELIRRSHRLKEAAEHLQRQLGEKLKIMHKGRRSVRAYQTVKRS